MSRNIGTIIIASLVFVTLAFGGSRSKAPTNLPLVIDQDTQTRTAVREISGNSGLDNPSAITWTIVDSMPNCLGPASWTLKAIAYDSATHTIAIIHRGHTGYSSSSGQLWYNVSRNGGTTWRRVSELNTSNPLLARYPGCTIYNPNNSADTNVVLFVFAAPELLTGGTAFGNCIYGVDALGTGSPVSLFDPGNGVLWSSFPIWAGKGTGGVFWACWTNATQNDFYLWRTTDYVQINQGVPSTWTNSSFQSNALTRRNIRGNYRNGRSYFSVYGSFPPPDPGITYNFGYSVSTNNGATWTAWNYPQPDWRSVPGLGLNYDLYTYNTTALPGPDNFSLETLVDRNNRVHMFYVVEDTLTLARSLVEILETGSGWNSKIIKTNLQQNTIQYYPGASTLNQMGNHINGTISEDGTVMALYWLDGDGNAADSLPDVWTSHRHINGNWSTPENLTQTPTVPEILLHCAPTLRSNGSNSYTGFLGRTYQIGLSTWPPVSEQPTYFYFGTHTFTQLPVAVEEGATIPSTYRLAQNYPNPFNPTTKISYSIPVRTDVKLSVYNVLGQEVATLVNEVREAGSYEVEFSAAHLSSGMYFYALKAGQFTDTKKLLVVK